MALLKVGYWQTTYFPSNYWQEDYWAEYGIAVPPTPAVPPQITGLLPPRKRGRKRKKEEWMYPLSKEAMFLFRDYLELKVKRND